MGVHTSGDRLLYQRVHDFFQSAPPTGIAFVRVLEVDQTKDDLSGTTQTSTLQVLETIWGDSNDIPQNINVNQHQYGEAAGGSYDSIFLRKGGVYLLPLDNFDWEGTDWWYIIGNQDVLFEVDNHGIIWSHSPFRGFNQFDGKDVNEVVKAITGLLTNENFDVAMSMFGKTLRWDYDLADVTILSVEPASSQWRSDPMFRYTLKSPQGEFTAISWEEGHFEIGENYLVLLVPTEETADGIEIWSFYATRIDNDGKIRGDSIFTEFKDYTVEQMMEILERVKSWYNLL